jgi:FtsZ-interacting cell division protein ZipA
MSFELDWITWVTLLVTAANAIAVIAMMIHGIYVRRKERYGHRPTNLRRRD